MGNTCLYVMGYSLYPLRCTDFWYCYHDDNRPEGTCFTKQHRKIVCYLCRYCYRNCPAVGTAAVRRLVNNSNCVISFVMCYDDSDLSVRKGESNRKRKSSLRLRSSAACLMLVQIGAYTLPGTALAVKKLPHMFRWG